METAKHMIAFALLVLFFTSCSSKTMTSGAGKHAIPQRGPTLEDDPNYISAQNSARRCAIAYAVNFAEVDATPTEIAQSAVSACSAEIGRISPIIRQYFESRQIEDELISTSTSSIERLAMRTVLETRNRRIGG